MHILAALLFQIATVPPAKIKPLPDFTVVASTWPPYAFVPNCSPGEPAIIFHLNIHNIGLAASTAINDYQAVRVQDNANPSWSGGAMLPAIPASGTATVYVPLIGLKTPGVMDGHHQFTATVNGAKSVAEANYSNDTLLIDVNFPAGFCGPVIATATAATTTATPHTTTSPPGAQETPVKLGGGLPAPTDLNNTITQGVCTKYGGPAAALACSVALPAGKLVLVWDYPYPNAVDGYRVYVTKSPNTVVRNIGSPKPVTTQTAPGVRLAILDPPPVGTCYAVTAFHGGSESLQSATSFCVAASNLAKTTTLNADQVFSMFKDVYINPDQPGGVNPTQTGTVRYGVDGASVGSSHRASDENTVARGYLHFNTSSLAGHPIAKAQLLLHGGVTEGRPATGCLTQFGAASAWKPGQVLSIGGKHLAAPRLSTPDVDLDVTSIVQSWASSPGVNTAFALTDDTDVASAKLVQITTNCITQYKSATLKVVYY